MAKFEIHEVFRLTARHEIVIAGKVVEGNVAAGMIQTRRAIDELALHFPASAETVGRSEVIRVPSVGGPRGSAVVADWLRPWDRDDFEAAVDSVTTLLAGAISAFGIWACYRANGGETGTELADRLLAIGFVSFVRFVVICASASVIWAYATVSLNFGFLPSFEELDLLFVGVVVLFWFRLHGHIESVARVRAGASAEGKI